VDASLRVSSIRSRDRVSKLDRGDAQNTRNTGPRWRAKRKLSERRVISLMSRQIACCAGEVHLLVAKFTTATAR